MPERSINRFSRFIGLSGAMLLICFLLTGTGAVAARGDASTVDRGHAYFSAKRQCTSCYAVTRQHTPDHHRCTHVPFARFAIQLLRSQQRAVDGAPTVGLQRISLSAGFDLAAQAAGAPTQAERFDETFKSIYAKTRRMQP